MVPYIVGAVIIALLLVALFVHNLLTTGKQQHAIAVIEKNLTGVQRDEWHHEQ